MGNNQIETFINQLNTDPNDKRIQKRSIGGNVIHAYVWDEIPSGKDSMKIDPYEFYFIKNKKGIFVSAVNVLPGDLHAFTLEQYRRKGFLKAAMKMQILPHIFSSTEENLQVTIDKKYSALPASEKLVKGLGFKSKGKSPHDNDVTIYVLKKSQVEAAFVDSKSYNIPLYKEEMDHLKHIAYSAHNLLSYIKTELNQRYGEPCYFDHLAADTRFLGIKIEDAHWKVSSSAPK